MFFAALSADPSPAKSPGQVREVIGPAATVIRTQHYQAEIDLTCIGNCSGNFPSPGSKRRQNITRMSCRINGAAGSTFDFGAAELRSAGDAHILSQFLAVDHSTSTGIHTFNRAIDMQAGNQQHVRVNFILSGTSASATCTASGTLETLQ
jgi:hypothetical protein